ncbi:MAG: respiratory nitrate reductase subunit gamma [Candidatus Omnitrophica bacterium]|nr:respiratory nitrate reductase subunit gamma [Candidatus Omnitrophota bacterium]
MLDLFLYIGLPYVALFSLIVGSIVRYKSRAFSYSSLSTQFLEDKWLAWASFPWHFGILIILLGHIAAFMFPGLWSSLVSVPVFLLVVETVGVVCSFLCILGLVVLIIRRFVDAKLQAVTSYLDVLGLLILLFQVYTGLSIALLHRWGAAWAPGALGPYLHGIFTLHPDAAFVQDMPLSVKLHIASAWVLIMLLPFTRMVHALAIPFHYFFRSPQKVVWTNSRAQARFAKQEKYVHERRLFVKASLGMGVSVLLLSLGTLDKFLSYFLKQDSTEAEQSHMLAKKLQHLKQSAQERELELERMSKSSIFVANMAELSRERGKYFIDYLMRPALAFVDEQGYPILLSAKCTHLGCTVGQDVDAQGRVLCPCHISYFNVKTGKPNDGSPAKDPLPHLGWELRDPLGNLLVEQDQHGNRKGAINAVQAKSGMLYIAKRFS